MNLSCTVNETGISAPVFTDILTELQTQYKNIFGADAYIAPDSQDGQLLSIFAAAINDNNNACINAYSAFSPSTAQGAGLSSVVKINGIQRLIATNSTVVLQIVGQAGTIINNGVAQDYEGLRWLLPAQVIIPISGVIEVLGTAEDLGAIPAPLNSVNTISTPQQGWQTVTNTTIATLGSPVESDMALRIRQSKSTSYPAQAILDAILAGVSNVSGVTKSIVYENATSLTDSNGIPNHSISVVVNGGDPHAIAQAIADRKTPGTGTYGTSNATVTIGGTSATINYFNASIVNVHSTINIKALPGYNSTMNDGIIANVKAYIDSLSIGDDVFVTSCIGAAIGTNWHVTSVTLGLASSGQSASDMIVPFNALAKVALADIVVVVVP